jgi:putative endonuclease
MFKRLPRTPGTPSELGREGERLAVAYLEALGFRVVAVNVRVPLAREAGGRPRAGEIDIVAYEGQVLVFAEVKARAAEGRFPAEAAVDARKRRRLVDAARGYRRLLGIASDPFRFDVVSVVAPPGERPRVRLTRGYFAESPRSRWTF